MTNPMEDAAIEMAKRVADREPAQPPDDVDADAADESLLDRFKKLDGPVLTKWDSETWVGNPRL
jgi:hypothetical protein